MRAEERRRRPGVERHDFLAAFGNRLGTLARVRAEDAAYVPELTEVAAAPVGGILAPEQLFAELVVESREVRFDECRIGLEQRDRVWRNQLEVGQQQLR